MLLKRFIISFILILPCSYAFYSVASDYPQTLEERKAEEVGSFVGTGGITFRPKKVKNESTRHTLCQVNKYLWQATLDVLDFAPLATVDSNSGIIITEWYSPKEQPKYSFKINVYIKEDVITPEAIRVKVYSKKLTKSGWVSSDVATELPTILENKILKQARELFVHKSHK